MTPKALNIIGLVFGMVGVAIVFVWGPPQPNLDPEGKLLIGEVSQEIIELRCFHWVMSFAGLTFVFFGFAFQLFATLMSPTPTDNDPKSNRGDGEHGECRKLDGLIRSPNISKVGNGDKNKTTDENSDHRRVIPVDDWSI